jgi:uncharacterized membrane protein YwzB
VCCGPELRLTFQGHFKVVHHKMSLILETACRRVKISKIWELWVHVACILTVWWARIAFDLSRSFQGCTSENVTHLGNCLSYSKNKHNLVPEGVLHVACIQTVWWTRVTFDLSRSFQGHTSQNVTYLGNRLP